MWETPVENPGPELYKTPNPLQGKGMGVVRTNVENPYEFCGLSPPVLAGRAR